MRPEPGFRPRRVHEESEVSDLLLVPSAIEAFNLLVFLAFSLAYGYQLFYVAVVLLRKPPRHAAACSHRFAVMIPARNEGAVVADLLRSIKMQDYPAHLIDVFVIADNCTDDTADVARREGAVVFERTNDVLVGKGYALDWGYQLIREGYAHKGYEAYFVFDADNVLDAGYFRAMNDTFDGGAKVSTSYRNSKNYATNWISAGYATWFLRESKYLNQARLTLGTSCAVSGTGFYVAADLLERSGGWKWHLLTEDIEFSVASVIDGERIAYCPEAVLYDEQPVTFRDSWNQRFRWAKDFYQVLGAYVGGLVRGMVRNPKGRRFACYDMLMTIAPAMLLTVLTVFVNLGVFVLGITGVLSVGEMAGYSLASIGFCLLMYVTTMGFFGILTTVSEWGRIRASAPRKLWGMCTFPLFMITYVPIALAALVGKAEWKPIRHTISVSAADFAGVVTEKPPIK